MARPGGVVAGATQPHQPLRGLVQAEDPQNVVVDQAAHQRRHTLQQRLQVQDGGHLPGDVQQRVQGALALDVQVGQGYAQIVIERPAVLVALLRILGGAAIHDAQQVGGDIGVQLGDRARLVVDDLVEDIHVRVARERRLPGEHLVEDEPEGEHVSARVGLVPHRLLRRHVGHGAHGHALCGELGGGRLVVPARLHQLGQPEVHHLGMPARVEDDVVRLDVPVDHAVAVRLAQRVRHRYRHLQDLAYLHGALAQSLAQGGALHVLHDDDVLPVALLQAIDHRDVGMIEGGRQASLAQQAGLGLFRLHEVVGQKLQSHHALQTRIPRLEDDSHAAFADLLHEAEMRQVVALAHGARTHPYSLCRVWLDLLMLLRFGQGRKPIRPQVTMI